MEYLLKASAIIALFYSCYRLFLQRETFFESNRWFLIIGLVIAALLPSVVIPVYIEYTPVSVDNSFLFSEMSNSSNQIEPFNWLQLGFWIYVIGACFFLGKLFIELSSLQRLIQKNPKKRIERFSLIEIFEKIAPFSFFKWIVYNPNQFETQELNHIINHEKVHAKEYHTIDVLLAQICCAVFWFNPLVWLYKKELQQNLEFIADKKAQIASDCKESYQLLLLKASVPYHPLVVTNNFYNSLIKKRIIMLHKSKSKSLNAWKYLLVIPALALFFMSFNTKEVYVVKEPLENHIAEQNFVITPITNSSELKIIETYFNRKSVQIKFTDIIRNDNDELERISINTKFKTNNRFVKRMTVNKVGTTIQAFKLGYDTPTEDITFIHLSEPNETAIVSPNKISFSGDLTIGKNQNSKNKKSQTTTEEVDNSLGENPLYIIEGKQYKKEDLPSDKFQVAGSITQLNKKESLKKYGKAGKDGAVIFNGKTSLRNTNHVLISKDREMVIITKDFTEADLNVAKAQLEKEGIKVKIRGVKRNSKGEITAIKIDVSSDHSSANYNINGDEPINPIQIAFDTNGKNISIGNGKMHTSHSYVTSARNTRDNRIQHRTNNTSHTISGTGHNHSCNNNNCDHDHEATYEFHSDNHEHEDDGVIISSNKSYVIKNSNTNNGKRVVTIKNSDGNDEIIELNSEDNVYTIKSKDGKYTSNNAVWTDDEDHKFSYKLKKKGKGNQFFVSKDGDEKPYILLDGKEITHQQMEDLDSDTIKSVNVLKGESATNKYGKKAKDGAIIISTKE